MFAIRAELLKAALADPETCAKIEKADTWIEIQAILKEFAEKHRFKVVQL